MADFEKKHPGIAAQKLWKLFEEKAEEQGLGRDFISAVGEVCAIGLNLSKYIVRFFPTFTLHDETHSVNVCQWMWVLLGEEGRKKLTPHEAALLLMAACYHDIGMAVSPEQEEQMRLRTYPGWDDYFRQNLKDDEEYEETKVISDRILRNFVRMRHHERIGENLRESDWPDALFDEELDRDLLLALCRSHGAELEGAELTCRGELYDLRMCAALLRLADLLDFDAGRAPEVLFRQMGLDRPKDAESWRSAEEHQKNRTGRFREKFVNGRIPYIAQYDNPGVEQEIRKYLDWVDLELTRCRNCLSQSERWKNLDLPYKVDDEKVKRKGYAAGKFRMTMDQDKVIDLLTGENLYSDPGVFVRELLQNSVDAVLLRAKQDPGFSLEQGLIQIDTWMDGEANTWFRIRDNGTGMNEHIIQNHFLKVGNSYYTSEEFKYANRHAPKGSYTAISRFGIGILSCFMGDKEHTQLKVSTKRFDENGKSGIRLDVTGLHGYYFLCKEKKHPASEPWFPKMPSINEEDRGYREAPGTTICVNTNLLRMGDLRSIQEILDKYVQFPEVRVTYNGPEGYKEYPTQQELMEAVYALNPDGVVKEYVHKMPDAAFEKLKKTFPNYVWEEKPTFSLQYEPLNWLSDSPKLTGVRVAASPRKPLVRLRENMSETICQGNVWSGISVRIMKMNADGIWIRCGYPGEYGIDDDFFEIFPKEHQKSEEVIKTWMPFDMLNLSYDELRVLNFLQTINRDNGMGGVSAYNGVLVEYRTGGYIPSITVELLREDFQPQVSMARDSITDLPLEATCCAAMCGVDSLRGEYATRRMATERELWEILDCHPKWKNEMEKREHFFTDGNARVQEILWLAYWKRKFEVRMSEWGLIVNRKCIGDTQTLDFPAGMFVSMNEKCFAKMETESTAMIFNRSHPFSKWLIENRAVLLSKEPKLYSILIKNMMLGGNMGDVFSGSMAHKTREKLNTIVGMIKNCQENHCNVPDGLVLVDDDFVYKSDEICFYVGGDPHE